MNHVMTFYKFAKLRELEAWQAELITLADALGLKGTVLLADEGINGTVAGTSGNLEIFAGELAHYRELEGMEFKYSTAEGDNPVYYRLKVRIKQEIVSFGILVDPERTGVHVDADRWNELLGDPEVVVVDIRNSYEVAIGGFPGAVEPGTRSFREFPAYVRDNLDPESHKRIAMYCTGGIRCEKASAYLLEKGFEQVLQLDGGVLKYLATVSPEENRWEGECFVFDQRVSVERDLNQGSYQQCFACRSALSEEDVSSPNFRQGICCPYCIDAIDDRRRANFEERQRQVELAAVRGSAHIGSPQA